MKLLHASDLRIGAGFAHVHRRADALREARLDAARSLVGLAGSEGVDCVLLAGNTLADNRLSHRELMDLITILSSCPCPVGILPGLTDPYTADSPYRMRGDLFNEPLKILSTRQPWQVGDAVIYPEPVQHRHVAPPLFASVPPEGLRIGVACREPGADLPELDYLAMGGSLVPRTEGLAHWPGTPEVLSPGLEPGSALVVTLKAGRPPRIRPKPLGQLNWLTWERTVTEPQTLAAELEALDQPGSILLDLTLQGSLAQEELVSLLALLESRRGRFHELLLHQRLQISQDQPLYGNRLLADVANRLQTLTAQAVATHDGMPETPELARHALLRLSTILRQAPSEDLS